MNGKYKIGDLYCENGLKGVVFAIEQDGQHGKILSLDEAELSWCRSHEWVKKIEVGCFNQNDGMENMKKVVSFFGWEENYPAFKWCRDKGDAWYLPAKEELSAFALKERDAVNAGLAAAGGTLIPNVGEAGRYWSSTEYDAASAWHAYMRYGLEYYTVKYLTYRVRAVARF